MSWRLLWIIINFFLLTSSNLHAATITSVTSNGKPLNFKSNAYNTQSNESPIFTVEYKSIIRKDATIAIFPVRPDEALPSIFLLTDNYNKTCNSNNLAWKNPYYCNNTQGFDSGKFLFYIQAALSYGRNAAYKLVLCDCCLLDEINDSSSACYLQKEGCPTSATDSRCRFPITGVASIPGIDVVPSLLQEIVLSFGSFVASTQKPCTIDVPSTNNNSSNSCTLMVGGGARGRFTIQEPNATKSYNIRISNPNQLNSNGNAMSFSASLTNSFGSDITSVNVNTQFYVNGKLTVKQNQAPGQYRGTYTISIDYS